MLRDSFSQGMCKFVRDYRANDASADTTRRCRRQGRVRPMIKIQIVILARCRILDQDSSN